MFGSKKKDDTERSSLLRIDPPGGRIWLVDLLGDSYLIGRGDPTGGTRVDFQIPDDEYLSRVHCRVQRDGAGYRIENLSPNGTLVDGALVEEPVSLKGKERIEIGEGTTLTYLVVTTEERRRLFEEQSAAKGGGGDAVEATAGKKPFYARPLFLGVLVFYGLLGLIVLGATGRKKDTVEDPGTGPYFTYLLRDPVETQRPEGDAQAIADRMWRQAKDRHGGNLLEEDGHAYELLLAARKVAGVMGYTTLAQALAKGEPFAQRSQLVIDDLEERISALYGEASAYMIARHWGLAYDAYARMAASVPEARAPVRRYAVHRMVRLRDYR